MSWKVSYLFLFFDFLVVVVFSGVAILDMRVNSLKKIFAISWFLCSITFSMFVALPPEKLNDPVRHSCGFLCLSSSTTAFVCMIDLLRPLPICSVSTL